MMYNCKQKFYDFLPGKTARYIQINKIISFLLSHKQNLTKITNDSFFKLLGFELPGFYFNYKMKQVKIHSNTFLHLF